MYVSAILKLTYTLPTSTGGAIGKRDDARFAACIPATRAVAKTSPLFIVLAATAAVVEASIVTRQRASARRALTSEGPRSRGNAVPTGLSRSWWKSSTAPCYVTDEESSLPGTLH